MYYINLSSIIRYSPFKFKIYILYIVFLFELYLSMFYTILGDIMDKDIFKLAEEIINYNEIKEYEIPDIDLYMDQVTSFMDSKLSNYKRSEEDIILTKTMINNYAKNKIIPSPNKKKYSKNHLMMLIWIYHLKQTLSINDIGKLMNFMNSDDQINFTDIYNNFLTIQKEACENLKLNLDNITKIIDSHNRAFDEKEKLFLLITHLISNANVQKRMAEKLIDKYFKAL